MVSIRAAQALSTTGLDTVSGFTMKDAVGTDQARVVLVCCAADAQPAVIHLAGGPAAAASGYAADT